MKRLFLVLMVSFIGIIGTFAQDGHRSKMSPEEFRQKQEAFITAKADLTQDEAAKFFPIYFELQEKKRALAKDIISDDATFVKTLTREDVEYLFS